MFRADLTFFLVRLYSGGFNIRFPVFVVKNLILRGNLVKTVGS